jgi:hypothetical protein
VGLGRSRSFYPADLVEQFYRIYDVALAEGVRFLQPQNAEREGNA